jgi:hypothetical protein
MDERRFHRRDIPWLQRILDVYPFERRRIDSIHLHHTWRPRRGDFRGETTILGMWRHHTQVNGWSDIAQHLTIDPDGGLWPGRPWDRSPASASGFNGNADVGPFMIEVVGDFDEGRDRLDGAQREAVVAVVAALQERLELPLESLRFHREMSSKTCPGTGVDFDTLAEEVRAARAANGRRARKAGPFAAHLITDHQDVSTLISAPGTRSAPAAEGEPAEEHERAPAWMRDLDGDERGLSKPELRALDPFVINLHQGRLSRKGRFRSSEEQVRALFEQHLAEEARVAAHEGRPLRILFWAHGGLVSEKKALAYAHGTHGWWRRNGIYPIYFVWETGLWSTLRWMIFRGQRAPVARGPIERLKNEAIEAIGRGVGDKVWGAMKHSATAAADPIPPGTPEDGGGARFVAELLADFLGTLDGQEVEIHAAGHSAGAIFHSWFLPLLVGKAIPVRSLHLLAPAVNVADYLERLEPLVAKAKGKGVDSITLYTMEQRLEEEDDAGPYSAGSLLYLISRALEAREDTPILGLQESLRADARLVTRFGRPGSPGKRAEVVYSQSPLSDGDSASRATSHGSFDGDAPTMNSIVLRLLALQQAKPAHPFETSVPAKLIEEAERGIDFDDADELPEETQEAWDLLSQLAGGSVSGGASASGWAAGEPAAAGWSASGAWSSWSPGSSWSSAEPSSASGAGGAPDVVAFSARGERRALCIGIDRYPSSDDRLAGCVADARLWSESLRGLGFDTALLLDSDASRQGILDGIDRLLASAEGGDTLVLQYSGHGTQVRDLDGDETDDDKDEALCPVDFRDGALLIDDDLRTALEALAQRVSLTVFLDCCHSGTGTRLAGSRPPARTARSRPRFVSSTPELEAAHARFRGRLGRSRDVVADTGSPIRWVNFSACQPFEVAYETDGQGDFTRLAVPLLAGAIGRTCGELQREILRAFGARPRQRPYLDPVEALEGPLFGAVRGAGQGAGRGASGGGAASSANSTAEAAHLLRRAADALERGGR